jgi:hypothetical protein
MIMRLLLLFFIGLLVCCHGHAQPAGDSTTPESDTLAVELITFTPASAAAYIDKLLQTDDSWQTSGDSIKRTFSRLIGHFHEPYDSVANRLSRFEYDSIIPLRTYISSYDTLPLWWLDESVFIVDTLPLEKEPFITRKTFVYKALDTTVITLAEGIPDMKALLDSILQIRDTITEVFIDTHFLQSRNIHLHQIVDDEVVPPLIPPGSRKTVRFAPDSTHIVIVESKRVYVASKDSPFYIVSSDVMPDSLRLAVETLVSYHHQRDSIQLFFSDIVGRRNPFWLTANQDELYRYWVKNQDNDSITIWIGNPAKFDITLMLEDDVYVERMEKQTADEIPITTLRPQRTLAGVQALKEIPVFWDYGLTSAFTLNQTYLSNWAKGGESSFSSMLDVRAAASYTNKDNRSKWESTGRLRYGTIITQEHGFRTNTDMVELNSQYNKVLRGKIDFSSVFYMKTQVAEGFKYPNDSVVVSKFLNPGTFTVGVGFEYKPFKNTSLNFSMLSYKNTFVLDTANINQSAHGIPADKRSRQEMGGQLVIRNKVSVLDGLNVSNAVRLFSGYLDKPQNVDVDWEINIDKQISWFFMIRLNLHFIYDDDIRFAVFDSNDQPVLLPDGSEKKVPKLQFKQFLGLTISLSL